MTRRFFIGGISAAAGVMACPKFLQAGAAQDVVRIVHCGDPQFGFGFDPKGVAEKYAADMARFERVIASVNALKPDLCFIAGDMTHLSAELEKDWPRLLKKFQVPVLVAPGNHDMGNGLTRENVERFERVFGYSYTSRRVGGWRFICGNSQYWRPTEEKVRQAAYEQWLADTFAAAKASGEKVILASHMPPYVTHPGEADTHENCPKKLRESRLKTYRELGAKFYLCGHTHTMLARSFHGMPILNAETTCVNFDERPFGFRLLTLHSDGAWGWDFHPVQS